MHERDTGKAPVSAYAGIFLCSLGVLMLEVLLTRVFSFTIWYHLAYLTISTALLGFGAAGSLLAARPALLQRDIGKLCGLCAGASGLALLAAMAILGPRPVDPQRMLTEPMIFFVGLLGYYVVVTVPFFLAGIAVSAPIATYSGQVNRLYAIDLLGAGLGCLAGVAALRWMDGAGALTICAAVLIASGACYVSSKRLMVWLGLLAIVVGAGAPVAHQVFVFVPTASKQSAKTLAEPGSEITFTRWSPINRVDIMSMADPYATWWAAFGRGAKKDVPGPAGFAIQYDGDNGSTIYQVRDPESMAMLDDHFLRAPYLLQEKPRVLIIGVGGGVDILNALRRGSERITAVELQPITVNLLKGNLFDGKIAEWTGKQFLRPEVNLVAGEGRHYVRSTSDQYDIVQITATDTFSAQSTGAYVLAESYLYTVEALEDYLKHLDDNGVVSIVLGDMRFTDPGSPWPLATRLTLVARRALENLGVTNPQAHILVIAQEIGLPASAKGEGVGQLAGSGMSDIIVKKTPFTQEEIARLRSYADVNGFQIRLAPDDKTKAAMAPLLNLPGPELKRALAEGNFSLDPLTDDQPFFYHVLRWKSLLSGGMLLWSFPGSTTGLLMLVIMLVQALILGTALIALPLVRGARGNLPIKHTLGYLLYFISLGLGFLFIEISFVQKYVLLLGYPTYSLSVTIFSLLIFAGFGAWLSQRGWGKPRTMLLGLLVVTIVLVALEIAMLPFIRESFLASSLPVRIGVTVLLQLPLGICLGMYFPTGIAIVREREPRLVPWAWAVNGVASVVSSVLAVILAMTIGFSGVAVTAACIYIVGTTSMLAVLRATDRAAAPQA